MICPFRIWLLLKMISFCIHDLFNDVSFCCVLLLYETSVPRCRNQYGWAFLYNCSAIVYYGKMSFDYWKRSQIAKKSVYVIIFRNPLICCFNYVSTLLSTDENNLWHNWKRRDSLTTIAKILVALKNRKYIQNILLLVH